VAADQWTAELWIPFSQLRFNPRTDQAWGLNLSRFRPTLDDQALGIMIPRTVSDPRSQWSAGSDRAR
jgi:hypothetical protein